MAGSKKKLQRSDKREFVNYLELKYGKEPKISEEELKEQQWNWH